MKNLPNKKFMSVMDMRAPEIVPVREKGLV